MIIHYLKYTEQLNFDDIERYTAFVSEERQKKIAGASDPKVKTESLLTGLFLRMLLAEHLKVPADTFSFTKNTYGRPALDGHPELFFSVSQKKGLICIGLHDGDLGIDTEAVCARKPSVARRSFTPAEQKAMQNAEDPDEMFYEIWTRKESYVKFLGTGFHGVAPDAVDVFALEHRAACRFCSQRIDDHLITVCTDRNAPPEIECIERTVKELLDFY
ncbi:MAG: 4'-phosphopantetheinyl transferase superfamily protein [Eubacterium sp.]|nr:4'-phosphopantetheinyl transferase superfamily protein [Eubacterium sp.]